MKKYFFIPVTKHREREHDEVIAYEIGWFDKEAKWHRVSIMETRGEALNETARMNGELVKEKVIELLMPCLERDPTLEKVVQAVQEIEV